MAINSLADEDLAKIFEQLPPLGRLLVSEVSKRWYAISRIPWRDIIHLDLSPIPGENIGPVVKQCPNLRTVFAKDRTFSLHQLQTLSSAELWSLKLYKCSCAMSRPGDGCFPRLSSVFSDNFSNAPWKELALCDFDITVGCGAFAGAYVTGSLPASLERLQDNGFEPIFREDGTCAGHGCLSLNDWEHLHQLSCLSLGASPGELEMPKTLRELCIGCDSLVFGFGSLRLDLPRLEVLFLNNVLFEHEQQLQNLATQHPSLRIVCITGSFGEEFTIPERRLFPNGFGSNPVPPLKIFVSKEPSEKITFTKSPANALAVYTITDPLPLFLEKKDIAPFFEGVWLAAQIKEGAKHGSNWWKYEGDTAASFRTVDDA